MWLHKIGFTISSISTSRNYTYVLHVSAIEVLHISFRIYLDAGLNLLPITISLPWEHIVSLVEIPHRLVTKRKALCNCKHSAVNSDKPGDNNYSSLYSLAK